MEEYKRMTVWELLMFLQKNVKINNNAIRSNKEAIAGVDSQEQVTPELIETVKFLTQRNANLTSDNFKLLKLFNSLIEFHKDHKQNLVGKFEDLRLDATDYTIKKIHFEDCLEKTMLGQMELNAAHPYISDSEFLNQLMILWRNEEEYEKCTKVQDIINILNN